MPFPLGYQEVAKEVLMMWLASVCCAGQASSLHSILHGRNYRNNYVGKSGAQSNPSKEQLLTDEQFPMSDRTKTTQA